jgi:hypothetical protein
MQDLETLKKEKLKLEEVIEILISEGTTKKYVDQYEEKLHQVKNAIQIYSITEQEKIGKSCSRKNCNCRCKK